MDCLGGKGLIVEVKKPSLKLGFFIMAKYQKNNILLHEVPIQSVVNLAHLVCSTSSGGYLLLNMFTNVIRKHETIY